VNESEAAYLDSALEVVSGSTVSADPPAKSLEYARRAAGHLFPVKTGARWGDCSVQQAGFACYKFEAEESIPSPPPWRSTPGQFAPYRTYRGADGAVCFDRFLNAPTSPLAEALPAVRQIHRAFDRVPTETFACATQLVGFGDGSPRQLLSRDSQGQFRLEPLALPPGDVVTTNPWSTFAFNSAFVAVWDGRHYTSVNASTGEQRMVEVLDLRYVTPEAGRVRSATLTEAGALVSSAGEIPFQGTLIATLGPGLLVANPASPTTLKIFAYSPGASPLEIPVTLPYRGAVVGCLTGIADDPRLVEFTDGARREVVELGTPSTEPIRRAFAPPFGRVISMIQDGFVVLEQADGLYAYRAL
jgi:hypothetical protein